MDLLESPLDDGALALRCGGDAGDDREDANDDNPENQKLNLTLRLFNYYERLESKN